MSDPLTELEASLTYMFELQKTKRHGKYINPLVEDLKIAIENYKEDSDKLAELTQAMSKAYPIIENYGDTYKVKQKMQALLGSDLGFIERTASENAVKDSEANFISWLSLRIGKDFAGLDGDKQVQVLLNKQAEKELRVKLGVHLRLEPDFLINLALQSANNFIKLLSSRLGFKFEKHQVAKAINHHGETMVDESLKTHEQVDMLIDFFDKRLSPKGYSIEKLLNDPLAKNELEKMQLIQYYQSQEYKSRQDCGQGKSASPG